jgi:hypothetical protein
LTAGILGLTIWGTVNLEQKFDSKWFLPTDSYAYKYLTASDTYFSTGQEQAGVYCSMYTLILIQGGGYGI